MAPRIGEVIATYKRELQRLHSDRFCRLVLFGSRAREDHREDSDIDYWLCCEARSIPILK